MRKYPSYRAGIRWIAEEDEPGILDIEQIRDSVSTQLLAYLFQEEPEKVADDIYRYRVVVLGD